MISEVVVPSLGATGGDITIETWLLREGEKVTAGAPLFLASTDKANVEVEAFRSGYLRRILVSDGTSAGVGSVVALISDSMDEALVANDPPVSTGAGKTAPATNPPAEQVEARPGKPHRTLASPLARRLAKEGGVDLSSVAPRTGALRIHRDDVLSAMSAKGTGQAVRPISRLRRKAFSPMRRAIATRVSKSKSEIPHFYVSITIEMDSLLHLKAECASLSQQNGRAAPTITDFVLAAAGRSLRMVPAMLHRFDGDGVIELDEANIGLVVGTDGMLIPVVRKADKVGVFQVASITSQLKSDAKSGRLRNADGIETALTISNLGMYGVSSFTAIINPPEPAILALGAVETRLAREGSEIVDRSVMMATLSADHRVLDGIDAAKFLSELKLALESPILLLLSNSGA